MEIGNEFFTKWKTFSSFKKKIYYFDSLVKKQVNLAMEYMLQRVLTRAH